MLEPKIIGGIILSNILEYSLKKYESYVWKQESSALFEKLLKDDNPFGKKLIHIENLPISFVNSWLQPGIVARNFSPVNLMKHTGLQPGTTEGSTNNLSPKVIGAIAKYGNDFLIFYRSDVFRRKYIISEEKLKELMANKKLSDAEKGEIILLTKRLYRISTRNDITHIILNTILKYHLEYFNSGNSADLKPLKQVQIAQMLRQTNDSFQIDNTVISRLTKNISVINPQGKEIPLKYLFLSKTHLYRNYIKEIIKKEAIDLESGRIDISYNDSQLARKLKGLYNITIPKRTVCSYRKALGIPSFLKRSKKQKYPPNHIVFSDLFPLTLFSLKTNAPQFSGVYELRFESFDIEYISCAYSVFYIGSAKDIRGRLYDHIRPNCRNEILREYLRKKCLFRYARVKYDWNSEEKNLYNLFICTFGCPPKCNVISP